MFLNLNFKNYWRQCLRFISFFKLGVGENLLELLEDECELRMLKLDSLWHHKQNPRVNELEATNNFTISFWILSFFFFVGF